MYESFYRLTGKPFQLSPDPLFLYASKGHKRAFAYLQYGLYQSEGFIVITGDVGAGKTTLVRTLIEQLDPSKVIAAQLVSTQLDAEDLVRSVALAFGISTQSSDKAHVLAELEAYLVSRIPIQMRALLIVDEAQNLTPRAVEELRMLSNFQVGDRPLLQSFLVGQPELRNIMRSPEMQQLRQRVIASYHLGPMDKDETRSYIEHRLTCAGWNGDPSFDETAVDRVYNFARGIPRRINTLCNRVMLAGFIKEKHTFNGDDVEGIIAEINEEAGPDLAAVPPRQSTAEGHDVTAASITPIRSVSPGVSHTRISDNPGVDDSPAAIELLSSIDQRLARLEKTMGAFAGVLRDMVDRGTPLRRGHEKS